PFRVLWRTCYSDFFRLRAPHPPGSTPFPYTTLFRSRGFHGATDAPGERAGRNPCPGGGRPGGTCRGSRTTRAGPCRAATDRARRSEEHTSELQSQSNLVCRRLLEKKKRRTLEVDGDL